LDSRFTQGQRPLSANLVDSGANGSMWLLWHKTISPIPKPLRMRDYRGFRSAYETARSDTSLYYA